MKPGKIEIEYFKDPEEIIISADADGLHFLAEVCELLIGKAGPAAHWHLSEQMGTLVYGSVDTQIRFIEDEDSKEG